VQYRPNLQSPFASHLADAIADSARRLLIPAVERDLRRHLFEQADAHATHVFARNLKGLLNQPPLPGHTVLGLDPGYRTGCKLAVVDPTGKVLNTGTIYPHAPHGKWENSKAALLDIIERYSVDLLAIGNGTASRETEELAAAVVREAKKSARDVHYVIVSEAGASVYSASPLAREELPHLDVTLRGAVSIARRLQDPLAELVKIDPRSIGVGLYQHDIDQAELAEALAFTVKSVVNSVGVDANTASPALLAHVAGIGAHLAERIVTHRDAHGPFAAREALQQVHGLGPKAYLQAAGFLRIRDGIEPLDDTAIHPESYSIARRVLREAGLTKNSSFIDRKEGLAALLTRRSLPDLAAHLSVGVPTLKDICDQLVQPGRDPRADLPAPLLRSDVLKIEDLRIGMELAGTVRNVVDFGAFVDIGLKHDALLHRSQIPSDAKLRPGMVVGVSIQSVENERSRVGLAWNTDLE